MECYRHRVIAYSLGNFVGYRTLATGGVVSLSGVLTSSSTGTAAWWPAGCFPSRSRRPACRDAAAAGSRWCASSRQDFGRRACHLARGAIHVP